MAGGNPKKSSAERRTRSRQEGIALIVVMTIIVTLTVLAAQFSYTSMVNLNMATNLRDETKAFYMAKSGFNIARLVLFYQKQVDQTLQKMNVPGLGSSIQLWKLIPIESSFTKSFVKGEMLGALGVNAPGEEAGAARAAKSEKGEQRAFESEGTADSEFGDFDGMFRAEVTDEEGKISIRNFDSVSSERDMSMSQLMTLILPARYNWIFENRDLDGQYTNRVELIAGLKDYQVQTNKMFDMVAKTETGGPVDPYYQKLDPPYQPKLARFDTLEEIRMSRGVGDTFMALFGDRLTIYPVSKINLNSIDDTMLQSFVCTWVKDRNHPFCTDSTGSTQRTVLERWKQYKALKSQGVGFFYTPSLQDIRDFFGSEGIVLSDSQFGLGKIEDSTTNSSSYFTIRSVGMAGNVVKHITAVVFTGENKSDILYWRED